MRESVMTCPPEHRHAENTVCYIQHKCRCAACREAMRARELRRRKLKAYGRWDTGLVDAAPVRAHVEFLRSCGMGWKFIGEVSGVGHTAMEQLIYGRKDSGDGPRKGEPQKRIGREKAEKILAVRPVLRPGRNVPSVGTRRRLQALIWAGWPVSELAKRLDASADSLRHLLRVGGEVTAARHHAVKVLFAELFNVDPPQATPTERGNVTKARKWARANGWVSALAWGERIDDPDEVPLGVGVSRVNGIDEELVERYWREGLSDREIGERMGCSYRSVFRVRKRMGWETKWAA